MAREDPGAALIPDFLWPKLGWIIGALVLVVVVFGVLISGMVEPWSFELPVMHALRGAHLPWLLVHFGLAIGSPAFFALVVLVLAVWSITRRSWPTLIACATVPFTVVLVEAVLKPIVDRRYVWGAGELYYPSGTAAGVAAWATLTWILAVPCIRRPRVRLALGLGLGALTLLTAISVVAAAKHFPIDAVGGVATGIAVVLTCTALIDRVTGAHRDRAGDRAPTGSPAVPISRG